jgi:hypothetical protein
MISIGDYFALKDESMFASRENKYYMDTHQIIHLRKIIEKIHLIK